MAIQSFALITIGALVSTEPKYHQTKDGNTYVEFNVAVNCFNANSMLENYYRVKVFEEQLVLRIPTLSLIKGDYVVLNGNLEIQYYNARTYPTIKLINIYKIKEKRVGVDVSGRTFDPNEPTAQVYTGNGEGFIQDNVEDFTGNDTQDYSVFGGE